MKINIQRLLAFSLFLVAASCSKNDVTTPTVHPGAYSNGFFVVNEGSYGAESGSLSFYGYGADTLMQNVFEKANDSNSITTNMQATLEYGTVYNHNLYLAVKAGGDLIKTDESTLKEAGRISGKDWRAFVGIDNANGLVSTATGVYKIDLASFSLGTQIAAIPIAETAEMYNATNNVFVASPTGTYILKKTDWSLTKSFSDVNQGFVSLPNGKIVGGNAMGLVLINPTTFDTTHANAATAPSYNEWGFTPSSITASTKSNTVYFASDGNKIFRYIDGDKSSLSAPFITLPSNHYFYGAAVRYDKTTDQLIVIATGSTWGDNNNALYFYDATSGALKKTISYTHYYFPALIVFH